jgi:mRNA interferase MazF
VYDARLDPVEGSEPAGTRPIVVVSRDAINDQVPRIVGVPCTTFRAGRRVYPSQVLLRAPEGGLTVDSIALADQVRALSLRRLTRRRGVLSPAVMRQIDRALLIALDLPGQQ